MAACCINVCVSKCVPDVFLLGFFCVSLFRGVVWIARVCVCLFCFWHDAIKGCGALPLIVEWKWNPYISASLAVHPSEAGECGGRRMEGGGRGLADVKTVLGYFQTDLNMSDVRVIITGVSGTSCAGCTVFVLSLQSDACGRSVL